ncbi:hypothetical protein SAMD00019534_063810, partial [Acytostelium subglobosum LB1]|uniref:hypothetical protein n=1 Tax=Acytostelium subglobosum LB1 TaxID=1410327 RepID=UPI000644A4E4
MINSHHQHTQSQPYDDRARSQLSPCRLIVDSIKLRGIKKQIDQCFKMITPFANRSDYHNHIMALHGNNLSMITLDKLEWSSNNVGMPGLNGPFDSVFTSIVYARGHVYMFGGPERQGTYTRYSLDSKQVYEGAITTISGGRGISTCYDGDKTIYLVGGHDNNHTRMNRISSFNIETRHFAPVGTLPLAISLANTYFHNGSLIIVVGNNQVYSFTLDPPMSICTPLLTDINYSSSGSNCFDHDTNQLYIITNQSFIRYSLVDKKKTTLSKAPDHIHQQYGRRMIYHRSCGIIYLGGEGNNYQYSIPDDKWTLLNELSDNDTITSRIWSGACLIMDSVHPVTTEPTVDTSNKRKQTDKPTVKPVKKDKPAKPANMAKKSMTTKRTNK